MRNIDAKTIYKALDLNAVKWNGMESLEVVGSGSKQFARIELLYMVP